MDNMNNNFEFGWDDEIDFSGSSVNYVTLEPGEYTIKAVKFERTVWGGSAKIPKGTNCARVYFEVTTPDGVAKFNDDLPLWGTMQWKIAAMFRCLGLRKSGDDKNKMPWSQIEGCTGKAKIKKRSWTGNDGVERFSNEIDKYLDPVAQTAPKAASSGSFDF